MRGIRIWALLLVAGGCAQAAPPRVLHLAPNGDDRWSGSLPAPNLEGTDGPLASLSRLQAAIRAERTAHPGSDVVAYLRGGTYPLTETMALGPEDAGAGGGSVVWEAFPGEQPIIDGGRPIRGFAVRADGLWEVQLPAGFASFEQLYVNGARVPRARTPNHGYFYLAGTIAAAVDPATGKEGPVADQAFKARLRDLGPLPTLAPEQLEDVVVSAYHSWEISRHRLRAIDPEHGLVFLRGKYPPKFGHYAQEERYRLENYRAALDEPGEWLLETDGRLLYLPRTGDDPATAEVMAAGPETMLRLAGTVAQPLARLSFRGLTFRHAGYLLPPEGAWSPQAACNVGAAIEADHAHDLRFEECTVERTGGYAIWFRN
ncbi:MAG: hypothetical protein HUU35_13650, partial [Armatimonadetes bacterium]|nr:hypothetical protein [Armatimonadota bacterium]